MFHKYELDEHSRNCQNLWKKNGKFLNNKKSSSHTMTKLNINKKEVSDSYLMAQEFNNYFCSIGEKLAEKFSNTNSNYKNY